MAPRSKTPARPAPLRRRAALSLGLLLPALLLAGCGRQPENLRLPLVERPSLDREQQSTRERLAALHDRAERIGQDAAKTPTEKAAAYGELGRHYASLRQFEAAAGAFENAALAAPEDRRWFYYQAVCLQELARPAEAAEIYEKALALAPGDPPTVLHLAEVRFEQRQLDLAQPLFEKASSLAPGCAAALWGLGRIAGEKGEWGRAVELLERAAAADPGADAIRYSLGQAWRGLGDFAKAQQWLEGSGQKRPRCADPLADEIGVLIHTTTLEVLRNRVAQPDFDPGSDLGYALHQLGEVVGGAEQMAALAATDTGLRADKRAEARWRLIAGALFAARGLDTRAEPELRRAAELDPQLGETHLRLGNLLARRGDFAAALEAYDRAGRLLPGDRELALRRGKVLVNLGRFPPAAGEFETAFAGGDGIVEAGLELAAVLGHLERLEAAAGIYAKVIEKAPQERRAREGEATVLILLGRLEAAKKSLDRSVTDLPREMSLKHALARLLVAGPPAVREPGRGLLLAREVFAAEPTVDRALTVAMGAAATGDFAEAVRLESDVIDDLERSGRAEAAARLAARLELYRAGKAFAARGPGDLIVSPPLLARAGAEAKL
jgi:tetratricopeptide (TPR) repeat protein